jgi:hypothetical protein
MISKNMAGTNIARNIRASNCPLNGPLSLVEVDIDWKCLIHNQYEYTRTTKEKENNKS